MKILLLFTHLHVIANLLQQNTKKYIWRMLVTKPMTFSKYFPLCSIEECFRMPWGRVMMTEFSFLDGLPFKTIHMLSFNLASGPFQVFISGPNSNLRFIHELWKKYQVPKNILKSLKRHNFFCIRNHNRVYKNDFWKTEVMILKIQLCHNRNKLLFKIYLN